MQAHQENAFGDYIFELRKERGWSLRQAAQRAGIAFSRLGEIERGVDPHSGKRFIPTYPIVLKLARAFERSPDELLRLAGYEPELELDVNERHLIRGFRKLTGDRRAKLLELLEQLEAELTD